MNIIVRDEEITDIEAIEKLTKAAFQNAEHTSHTEHFIVNSLRTQGQLTISLVAIEDGSIIGHVAISPVEMSSGEIGWYGLGPISVHPDKQDCGIGSLLMNKSLQKLKQLGAQGCVLLGEPSYYSRFGFKNYPELIFPNVPSEYFQAVTFSGNIPKANVKYHEAFNATQ
ncbi:GNAT family N-acetyltransferase [Acinetobacter pittii]|uniref:GNAT family N-acetyltransferase n=1 Tax=Acinetobacter pittii TaxID=48296 RepID=UPI000B35DC76|nr:N-acetyltransferase [Acinetobacter pittii]